MKINKLSQLNIQNKSIINISLKFIVLALIIFLVIFPIFTKIKQVRRNIFEKKIEFDRKNSESKTYSKLSQTLNEISPQLKILDNIFINHNRELEFITTLEGIAQKNNVKQTIKLGDLSKKTDEAFFSVPIELSINGNEIDTYNYLLDLENLNYYINVNSIYILSKGSNKKLLIQPENDTTISTFPETTVVDMSISANSYWKN